MGKTQSTEIMDTDISEAFMGGQRRQKTVKSMVELSLNDDIHRDYSRSLTRISKSLCISKIYSLSRVPVRPHATQATDAIACTFSTHSTHHAEVMLPFVFPWRTHCLLGILPIQLFIVCLLLTCSLHSNYHRNYIMKNYIRTKHSTFCYYIHEIN